MSKTIHRSPAFQFYADDFLAGTLDLSQEEVGAYIRLLCHQWNRGSIPVETEKQQRLAGGSVSVDVLAKFRMVDGSGLVNERLERERAKQAEFRQMQREKGLLSAKARRNQPRFNHGSTAVGTAGQPNDQPNTQPEGNSPASSFQPPNTTPKPPRGQPVEPESFIAFWNIYPKKVAKPMALKSWLRISPNEDTVTQIIQDVTKRKASEDWTKDQGKYIPNPSTYLNNQRWTDLFEIPETKETLHAKLTSHPANPKGTQCTHATEEEKADFKAMLERYKAMP
jgi:uncharacterized protein YdaU (DUF1376 family)